MLLETLDIKKNDIIIYSQNLFDLEKNFKIIYKDDPKKVPQKITYNQVCKFINEFTPKNLIVYRLLTNIRDFQISLSKYGYFLNINGVSELIYFDPVFAVKELEDYPDAINIYDLRFRIQQVGLTTLNRKDDLPNFAEIYAVDLIANEAKFQNDKVFADAIFLFSKDEEIDEPKIEFVKNLKEEKSIQNKLEKKKIIVSVKPKELKKELTETAKPNSNKILSDKESVQNVEPKKSPYVVKPDKEHINGIKLIRHDIDEDKDFDYKQILKVGYRKSPENNYQKQNQVLKKEKQHSSSAGNEIFPKIISHDKENKSAFGKFLQESRDSIKIQNNSSQPAGEKGSALMDIFKSSSSFDEYIKERENKQIVLKLNHK